METELFFVIPYLFVGVADDKTTAGLTDHAGWLGIKITFTLSIGTAPAHTTKSVTTGIIPNNVCVRK